jgi:ribosomal protein S18 acetylase RimI-like enzyme
MPHDQHAASARCAAENRMPVHSLSRPSKAAASRDAEALRIEPARPADWQALVALEEASFAGDRICARSWRGLLASASATVTVARSPHDAIAGAAVLLRRANTSVARLYSISTAPGARGRGVSAALLGDAIARMRDAGAAVLRLETRVDNVIAQSLFERHGFVRCGRKAVYYEDGQDALLYEKSLWHLGAAERSAALDAPYYGQTLDFTCGPCALMMAMAALDPATRIDRTEEIRLWREATTVFMAAGHGGCGPHGLALAAERRGFRAIVHAPAGEAMFVDSVRDPRKKEVIGLVEADFRSALAATRATLVPASMSAAQLVDHLRRGRVPIVLISLWRLHGEKGPHWVVVTGFDGHVFRILDPIVAPSADDPHLTITVDEFHRITRYGRRRQAAAVVIAKES